MSLFLQLFQTFLDRLPDMVRNLIILVDDRPVELSGFFKLSGQLIYLG